MSIALVVNGVTFNYPETGDTNWGVQATAWANAVTSGMLQKAGGAFTLTAEVDFGATYGLKTAYYKTQTSNISTAGQFRLARADVISFRNQANSGNLDLGVNSSDVLTFNGEVVPAGLIVNADVDPSAAIAFSKMAALTASRALVSDGSGVVSVSAATSSEVAFLSGVTSAIQAQIDGKLSLAGGTMTGDLILNGDAVSAFQAVTLQQLQSTAAGLQPKTACRVATTANVNISNGLENGDTIDGVVLATGDRILVKNQSAPAENGIYVAPASGAASRATDMDTWTETLQAFIFITEGTANAATQWVSQSTAGGTIGVTALTFAQFGAANAYTADNQGVILTGSQFSLQIDGSTLSQSGSGVKVASGGLTNTEVNASAAIALSKLAATTASRALVSDGSGFVSASAVTATELGYVSGATSAIQTQLDGKIPKTLTSSTGDMIYASSANTPARLAVGTNGYVLQSNGTIPVWTDQKISYTICQSSGSYSFPTTFTKMTLTADGTSVNPLTFSSSVFQFPNSGTWIINVSFGLVDGASGRQIMIRLRNTTDSTTNSISVAGGVSNSPVSQSFVLPCSVATGKDYELQAIASGSGVTASGVTLGSTTSKAYIVTIERIRQ